MNSKNMSERITFLKKILTENEFGERLENYNEAGKGWAAIKFKSAVSDKKQTKIIYQITLQRPIPDFQRLIWRGQKYNVLTDPIIEYGYHLISFLIQSMDID